MRMLAKNDWLMVGQNDLSEVMNELFFRKFEDREGEIV